MFNSSKLYIFRAHYSFQNSFIFISFVTTLRMIWSHHSPVSSGKTSSGGCSPGLFVSGRKDKVPGILKSHWVYWLQEHNGHKILQA